jgi:hypothetical protein
MKMEYKLENPVMPALFQEESWKLPNYGIPIRDRWNDKSFVRNFSDINILSCLNIKNKILSGLLHLFCPFPLHRGLGVVSQCKFSKRCLTLRNAGAIFEHMGPFWAKFREKYLLKNRIKFQIFLKFRSEKNSASFANKQLAGYFP